MAESWYVFLAASDPLEQIVDHIAAIMRVPFHPCTPADARCYEARTPYAHITIFGDHGFENDRDMPFEDYPYAIEIRAIRDRHLATNVEQAAQWATRLFEQLKATDRYSLLLVWDVQQKLQEHHPSSRAVL
jgi:hypothetical protein